MSKIKSILAFVALMLCGGAWALPNATDYSQCEAYKDWSYAYGILNYKNVNSLMHATPVSLIGSDGTTTTDYTLNTTEMPWNDVLGNQTSRDWVLRYAEAGYKEQGDAQFDPLTIGGLIVTSLQAEGKPYILYGNNAGKRVTILGSYTTAETLFKFEKSFTVNRNSDSKFIGNVNVDVAEGAVFNYNGGQTSYKTVLTATTNCTKPTLRLHGEGQMKVVLLDASANSALDFSDLRARENSNPFIDGSLTVSESTQLVLPEGITEEKPLKLCSGTLTGLSSGLRSVVINGQSVLADLTITDKAITAVVIHERMPDATFKFTGNASGGSIDSASTWFTGWDGEGGDAAKKMIGPDGKGVVPMTFHVDNSTKWHPYKDGMTAKDAFTLAAYVNTELSQPTANKYQVIWCMGWNNAEKTALVKASDGSVQLVHSGTDSQITKSVTIDAAVITPGYHLFTATFSTTAGLSLTIDNNTLAKQSDSTATTKAGDGIQIGGVLGNCQGVFELGQNIGIAALVAYDQVLSDNQIKAIAIDYPTSKAITVDVNPTDNKELLIPSMTVASDKMLGVTHGTLTIPEGASVETPRFKIQNTSSDSNRTTVNIAGKLTMMADNGNKNVWGNDGKGLLFGHWHGQGTYNITGTIDASKTYLETVYTAKMQTINLDGGTITVKSVYANKDDNTTFNLKNGGRLNMTATDEVNVPFTNVSGDNTISVANNQTISKPLTLTAGTLNLEVADTKTLTISGAISGEGEIVKKGSGTLHITGSSSSTIVFNGDGTLTSTSDSLGVITRVSGKGIEVTTQDGVSTYSLFDAAAYVGDKYYATLEEAIAHANGSTITLCQVIESVPEGWTYVKSDVINMIRPIGNIYYVENYFNNGTGDKPTLKTADGVETSYTTGDTVVLRDTTGGQVGCGDSLYFAPTSFPTIKVERDITFYSGTDDASLDGSTITIADGKTLTFNEGATDRGVALGSVTFNKVGDSGTGKVSLAHDVAASSIAGTATIEIGSDVTLTPTTMTSAVSGEGKIVYTGSLPNSATCTSFMDAAWHGTVVIKNYDANQYVYVGKYANSGSNLTLDGVKGYIHTDGSSTYPHLSCNMLTIGTNGIDPVGQFSSGKTKLTCNKLLGSGKILVTVHQSNGYNFFCIVGDASEFTGTIDSDYGTAAQLVFAANATQVDVLTQSDYVARSVRVMEGAMVSLGGTTSVGRLTGGVFVSGTLNAAGTVKPVNGGNIGTVKLCASAATITTPQELTVDSAVDGMEVVRNGTTYSLRTPDVDVVTVTINGETKGYPTIEAAIEAAAAADGAVITLTDPNAEAPAGFIKLEGGVLKACDYVVISPNAYVSDWQTYVTARQEMPAAEGLVLGVKNATEIYTAYPYAAGKTDGTPRNAAESIHKWIGIMQRLGTKYFVLGGPWKDASNISESDKDTVIPGITAYPIKPSAISIMNDRPSDLYYACHFLANEQKYVWDPSGDGVYVGFHETNPDIMTDPRHFQPTCVVSRMAFWPGFDGSSKTYADLIAAYKAKLVRGEAYDFAGNGYYLSWVDRAISYRADGMPDAYDVMADRLHAIVNQRTANELLQIAVTQNLTAEDLATKKVPLLTRNWEIAMPFGHGTPEGAAGLYGSDYVSNTGLTKFFMANVPCFTGYLGAGDATLAHCALSNPNGGALVSINNTGYGYTTEIGLTKRYVGISEEMLDYTLDAYVAGATAGEAWRTAISDFAGNVLDPATMAAKLEARGYDGTDATYKIDNKYFVYAAIVEEELFGDPLVAINERDVYAKDNTFATFLISKDSETEVAAANLRPTDRIAFDKTIFTTGANAINLASENLSGHRLYFVPSEASSKAVWTTASDVVANQQILVGKNTTLRLVQSSKLQNGSIISGEGVVTVSGESTVIVNGLVQIYTDIGYKTTSEGRNVYLFALGTMDSALKVKAKLLDDTMGFGYDPSTKTTIYATCNDFGLAGATYMATVEGDAPESMKTVVVPEGTTVLTMLPSQTADLRAITVNQDFIDAVKVQVPSLFDGGMIDLTSYFTKTVEKNILSLQLKETAKPAESDMTVSMPGNDIKITVQNPIPGLCYSIVAADSADGFVDEHGVEKMNLDESERKQVMPYYGLTPSAPLTYTYDPAKKVQYFKVRVSPSANYGK